MHPARDEEREKEREEDFIVHWQQQLPEGRNRTWKCAILPRACAFPVCPPSPTGAAEAAMRDRVQDGI